jgi:hypothetical protein
MFSPGASSAQSSGPFLFSNLVTVKLGPDNFLHWRASLMPILRSHFLVGFIDGSFPCPSERVAVTTPAGTTQMVPNPEYRSWIQQDQAILSAIVSSCTPAVSGLILFATTAQDAWTTLDGSFSTQSSSRSMQIRNELSQMKKLDLPASSYLSP